MTAPDPQARIAVLERELQWAQLKIQVLEERLRQQRIRMLGPRSETLNDLQLDLLAEEEPGVTRQEVEAESHREPVTQTPQREGRPPRRSHPGRQRLPENLRRVEQVLACASKQCTRCGAETAVLGYDESEQLDVEPASYFVRVIKREKRACGKCVDSTVMAAPLPDRIVEKGLASDNVVIQTGLVRQRKPRTSGECTCRCGYRISACNRIGRENGRGCHTAARRRIFAGCDMRVEPANGIGRRYPVFAIVRFQKIGYRMLR